MKQKIFIITAIIVLFILLAIGCSKEQEESKVIMKEVKGMQNNITDLNIGGSIGEILKANEAVWIHTLLEKNPRLLDGFLDPDNTEIGKALWHGEFPGKLLSGIAQTYLLDNNAKTKEVGDEIVALLKQAQKSDGYLGPWPENVRLNHDTLADSNNIGKWDTWGIYHCVYGLYTWYQVTGSKDALDVAVKALDCIYNYFIKDGNTFASQKWGECNFAIAHAFALLYEETGYDRYLECAKHIVNTEWKNEYLDFYTKTTLACDWMSAALEGVPFYASNQPRWESLYALETLAVLYRITDEKVYADTMDSLWWGMVMNDRHNTGSFGTGEGATGNIYGDGSETCNTVAWMAFSTDYLKLSKNSYVADELELSFYNAALGSLLANNREFIYMNSSNGKRTSALIVLEGHSFDGGRDMSCCQANGNRGITQPAAWALLTDKDGIYVNYFGEMSADTALYDSTKLTLKTESQYPKNGSIKMTVSISEEKMFSMYIRIPSWSDNTTLKVNSETFDNVKSGEYYKIERTWKDGDVIELELDMQIHFWMAEPKRIGTKVSVYYGPMLLTYSPSSEFSVTSTKFKISDLRALKPVVSENSIVAFETVTDSSKPIILRDYYSAGKDGSEYVSWLITFKELETYTQTKGGRIIWNNK